MSGHEGKRNQMKGRAMSMKQNISPLGWIFFATTYAPYESVFWAPIGHPIAQLTWGLIDLKLFPIKGVSKNEV